MANMEEIKVTEHNYMVVFETFETNISVHMTFGQHMKWEMMAVLTYIDAGLLHSTRITASDSTDSVLSCVKQLLDQLMLRWLPENRERWQEYILEVIKDRLERDSQ